MHPMGALLDQMDMERNTEMSAASRRRRQHAIGFRHLAGLGRPIYRRRKYLSISEAIMKERALAAKHAKMKMKSKRK